MQANCYAQKEKRKEEAYRVYMAEAIKNVNEILANNFSGSYMKLSYRDILNPKPVETRTADQIIDNIRNGLQRLQ